MMEMDLRLDYGNMLAETVQGGQGIAPKEIAENLERMKKAAQSMEQKRAQMAFRAQPFAAESELPHIDELARRIRENCEAFVVLGIGGSALGAQALHTALSHLHYNEQPRECRKGPRFYVEDNIDPIRMKALLDVIDLSKTCFNVISKSGETSETMAQFLIIASELKRRGLPLKQHIVITTDARKGNLLPIAQQEDIPTLVIPDGIGGRFSVLTPVGLLPAAVLALDIEQLLAGAQRMEERCSKQGDPRENIAYWDAALQYMAMRQGKNISVMMPYSDALRYVADWYAQLWAESLGRPCGVLGDVRGPVGQTPVKALGVTDQHSQIQLYTQGPMDKVITFLAIEHPSVDVKMEMALACEDQLGFLAGHTLGELLQMEQKATAYALTKAHRMNKAIILPKLNAYTMGQLLQLFMLETAYMGELLEIYAFDQPGVEEGKRATYALLGRAGYEDLRKELQAQELGQSAKIL